MCVRVWEGREQGRMESTRYNHVQFFPDLLSSFSKCYQYLSCWCFLNINFISDFWLIAYCYNKKRSTNAQQRQSMLFFRCFFHQGICVVKNQLGYICLLSDEESWRLFIAWNPEIEKRFVHCRSWPIRWYLCVQSVVGEKLNSAVLGNLLIEEMNWAPCFVLILKTTQQSSVWVPAARLQVWPCSALCWCGGPCRTQPVRADNVGATHTELNYATNRYKIENWMSS